MYKFLYYPTKLQKIIEITKHSKRKKQLEYYIMNENLVGC